MRSRMSLIPRLFSHWWETLERPHRLMDQNFGKAIRPDQLFSTVLDNLQFRPFPYSYYRPWIDWTKEDENGWSIVKNDKDKFHVVLDVQQFKPEEVNVKLIDNFIVVEGKHEEKQDDHGTISRHFIRKYLVPDQCDPERATSTLSADGILTITAPRKPEAIEHTREKNIKIERIEKSKEDEPQKTKQSQ